MILIMSIILCIISLCLSAIIIVSTISVYRDYKIMQKQLKRDKENKKIEEITRPLYFHEAVSGIVVPAEVANTIVGSITEKNMS